MCHISKEKGRYIERNLATFLQILAIENPKITSTIRSLQSTIRRSSQIGYFKA
jgi:hypothetical protein